MRVPTVVAVAPLERRLVAVVTRGLGDERDVVRGSAAASIGSLCISVPCAPEVVDALAGAAQNDPDGSVRRLAARAVQRIHEHEGATPGAESAERPRIGDE